MINSFIYKEGVSYCNESLTEIKWELHLVEGVRVETRALWKGGFHLTPQLVVRV